MSWCIEQADCVEAMRDLDEASVDAIVTDPPYGLEFMGKEWDRLGATAEAFREALDEGGEVDYHGKGNAPFGGGGQRVRYGKSAKSMQDWHHAWATQALRVLKPGGHLLAAGGSRTYHRLTCAIEDAGFEIRDCITHLHGQGFPKSHDVSKAIDKAAGAERKVVGFKRGVCGADGTGHESTMPGKATGVRQVQIDVDITAPATPEAERWQGWGTALKPAAEFWVLARKPLVGTVAQTVTEWGTGALNVDGCRVETAENLNGGAYSEDREPRAMAPGGAPRSAQPGKFRQPEGRWPPNVAFSHTEDCEQVGTRRVKGGTAVRRNVGHSARGSIPYATGSKDAEMTNDVTYADDDGMETVGAWRCSEDCPVRLLDEQTGELTTNPGTTRNDSAGGGYSGLPGVPAGTQLSAGDSGGGSRFMVTFGSSPIDSGNAERFRYQSKASRAERNAGLPEGERSSHPTVKSIALMRWLVRLVTPPGSLILDPFTGSGSTGIAALLEGFDFLGIEREAEYVEIARARLAWWEQHPEGVELIDRLAAEERQQEIADAGQLDLFEEAA